MRFTESAGLMQTLKYSAQRLSRILTVPVTNSYRRVRRVLNPNGFTTRVMADVRKGGKELVSGKPTSLKDYFAVGNYYLAKKVVYIAAIVILVLPILYLKFLHPVIRTHFLTTDVVVNSAEMAGYTGKVRLRAAQVLEDVSLRIPSGATVGILGGTGSGKSTLVSLIPRLYKADEGVVSVGGRSVAEYTMEHLRDAVSVVLQKNTLFSGTIRENLLWGNPGATEEQLQAACRAACADEFLSQMPDGLDTDLGQGGVNVSGGQKQRLCIARAILKQPKVLILDDSTSAVDTATDAKIRHAFREELQNTTKLIIAQRVSSIADADLILVMDRGRIAAQGTHEELMKTCEIYRDVYTSQQEGVSIGG